MKRFAAGLLVATLACSFSLALAGEAAKGAEISLTGWITGQNCGAKDATADGKACALKCHKDGSPLVLYVPATKKTVALDKQDQAEQHVGVQVKVTGMMQGETLKISKIEEIKAG